MPLVTGDGSSEEAVEGVNTTIDVGLCFPLVLTPSNSVSFGGVVDGKNIYPLELRLSMLDGRDGGLMMGGGVTDKSPECRFDFSQSVRCRLALFIATAVGIWPSLD